ncbi:hypothetical protein JKY79_02650 [Candidatus Babeliales bacterium]|nr:hypothetical protein [Candidatus Babeliales bacterium]
MNSQFDDMRNIYTSIEEIVVAFCESLSDICSSFLQKSRILSRARVTYY